MFRIYLTLAFICVFIIFVKCVAEGENKYSENFITSEGLWRDDDIIQDRINEAVDPVYLPKLPVRATASDQTSRLDVGGIIGSLGLKKGASILGLIIFPLLFPLFLLLGFLLTFIFLFVSIGATSGTAVTTGRHISNAIDGDEDTNSVYQNILDSDECVERISCEIMKRFKTSKSKELLIGILEKLTSNEEFLNRISLAAYRNEGCPTYTCNWKNTVIRVFNVGNLTPE